MEIHVPNVNIPHGKRVAFGEYTVALNSQIGRIFNIRDPNVEIIYICPTSIDYEVRKYYDKLIEGFNVPENQITILTPDLQPYH